MHTLKRSIILHNDNIIFYIFSNISISMFPTMFQTPYFNELQNQIYFYYIFFQLSIALLTML